MRQKTINIYTIDELHGKAREKALETLSQWATDHDWWDTIFEDARNIGLNIKAFDFYPKQIEAEYIDTVDECIHNIIAEHGEATDTYQLAKQYEPKLMELNKRWAVDDPTFDDDYADFKDEFMDKLMPLYLDMLEGEYEYLGTEENLIEMARANEYEFDEKGEVV